MILFLFENQNKLLFLLIKRFNYNMKGVELEIYTFINVINDVNMVFY